MDVSDDQLVGTYVAGGNPVKLADEDVSFMSYDPDTGYLYAFGSGAGPTATVIDTNFTLGILSDDVSYVYRDNGVWNTTNNTRISLTPTVYARWPGRGYYDRTNGLMYSPAYWHGLYVIDTKKTRSFADDTAFIYTPTGVFETTNASPGTLVNSNAVLAHVEANAVFVDESAGLVYAGTNAGLTVIDTQGTVDPADDTLVQTYSTGSDPALPGNDISVIYADPSQEKLYVGTYSAGLSVLDMNGTVDPSDDTLEKTFDTTSVPSLNGLNVTDIFLDVPHGLLYVSTVRGLTVLRLDGAYNTEGKYLSQSLIISQTPTEFIMWDEAKSSGQSVSLRYRTGDGDAVWRDDFDDGSAGEYAGDLYGWGSRYQTASESGGTMKLSDPASSVYGSDSYVYFWIDTGKPASYFPRGSAVKARVRINSSTRQPAPWYNRLFSDDYNNVGDLVDLPNNEWRILSFDADRAAFSKIGFFTSWRTGTWNDAADSFEIDWIRVETPDSSGHWDTWSDPCSNHLYCPVDPSDLTGQSYIQYRLDLATTDTDTTPVVNAVHFADSFELSGTYTSQTALFPGVERLRSFEAVSTVPGGGGIAYEYSIDQGTTWLPLSANHTFPDSLPVQSFIWRASFTSDDTTRTPVLHSIRLLSDTVGGGGTNPDGSTYYYNPFDINLDINATIAIACDNSVVMSAIVGTGKSDITLSGTDATNNMAMCNIKTNASGGYKMEWSSSATHEASGALKSTTNASDTISPFSIASSSESWSIAPTSSEWGAKLGASSEGYGTGNGGGDYSYTSAGGWGTNDGYVSGKWMNVPTTSFQIMQKSTETDVDGEYQYLVFGAEIGADKLQPTGSYSQEVTVTVTTL